MRTRELGKIYGDGEPIILQGEIGDCMYVLQAGQAEVVAEGPNGQVRLAVLEPGDVFGEMALFTKAPRSTTVRAVGEIRALTIDKKGFLKRVHEDPSLAFRILQKMSQRILEINREVVRLNEQIRDTKQG